jgi:protein-tyrosine phosphatase
VACDGGGKASAVRIIGPTDRQGRRGAYRPGPWGTPLNVPAPLHVDFHNHIIPAVDDGAQDEEEAARALQALVAHGVGHVVATPHIEGSLTARPAALQRRLAEIDDGFAVLQAVAREHCAGITVHRGAEVMLDTPEPDLRDPRMRLAGGPFALVEYPFMNVPPNSTGVIRHVVAAGVRPIIAHPERYLGVTRRSRLPHAWREAGALLQVNAGSLTGRYGHQVRDLALWLLESGIVDYVCSDYHARGRPSLNGARTFLAELDASEQTDLLLGTNPRRMLDGHHPLPVPPLQLKPGVMQRLKRWFN